MSLVYWVPRRPAAILFVPRFPPHSGTPKSEWHSYVLKLQNPYIHFVLGTQVVHLPCHPIGPPQFPSLALRVPNAPVHPHTSTSILSLSDSKASGLERQAEALNFLGGSMMKGWGGYVVEDFQILLPPLLWNNFSVPGCVLAFY